VTDDGLVAAIDGHNFQGWSIGAREAKQQPSAMLSTHLKTRLESQFCRMKLQMYS
jgi:hypothetical protein